MSDDLKIMAFVSALVLGSALVGSKLGSLGNWAKNPRQGLWFVIGFGILLMGIAALMGNLILAVIGGFVSVVGAVLMLKK